MGVRHKVLAQQLGLFPRGQLSGAITEVEEEEEERNGEEISKEEKSGKCGKKPIIGLENDPIRRASMSDDLLEGEADCPPQKLQHKRCLHQNQQQQRKPQQLQQQIFIDSTCIRWKCDIEIK